MGILAQPPLRTLRLLWQRERLLRGFADHGLESGGWRASLTLERIDTIDRAVHRASERTVAELGRQRDDDEWLVAFLRNLGALRELEEVEAPL